jgi:heme oxygenase (staphylobilin-producing)
VFVQMRTVVVKEGNADKVVERFSGNGAVESCEGFIDKSVMVKRTRKGDEEVVVMIRWSSEEAWKNWEKSDVHIEGHRQNRGKPQPDYLVESFHGLYDVRAMNGPGEPE